MPLYKLVTPDYDWDPFHLVVEYCVENNISHTSESISKYLNSQLGKVPTIVCEEDDYTVGVISFVVMPSPFNKDVLIGRKIACFVTKDYRNLGIGSTLLTKAEEYCKNLGATKFYFSSPQQPEGYSPFETEYQKDI